MKTESKHTLTIEEVLRGQERAGLSKRGTADRILGSLRKHQARVKAEKAASSQ